MEPVESSGEHSGATLARPVSAQSVPAQSVAVAEVGSEPTSEHSGASNLDSGTSSESSDTSNANVAPDTGESEAAPPSTILAPARPGRIEQRAVRQVIAQHQNEVIECYSMGLRENPNLRGDVRVRFLVGPRGTVEDGEVYHSTLGHQGVEDCIATALRSWRFPRPRPRGRSVLLLYPFHLATE